MRINHHSTNIPIPANDDCWHLADQLWHSRLLMGTGKYQDLQLNKSCLEIGGAEIVTFSVRRLPAVQNESLFSVIDPKKYFLLPNTAGCYQANDAIRCAEAARELLNGHAWIKLEVIGCSKTLFPDVSATLEAATALINRGFQVLAYTSDDPVVALELAKRGCAAVMPMIAPIGSGLGITNPHYLRIIIEQATTPIIVDAGIGTASDATKVMEMGATAVLLNTAVAKAMDPKMMAAAMKAAVQAGRMAFLAKRMPKYAYANASSPIDGLWL